MKRLYLVILIAAAWVNAYALDSDRDQPIRIQADAAMVNDNAGTSTYRGNVVIRQGTLLVTADEVEIFTRDEAVIQIIAKTDRDSSELAHYEQQTNADADMVYANARKITYLVQEDRLHLAGNARLQQIEDVFTGELLYYDVARGIVNLSAGSNPGDRVNMTITPKKSQN